MASLNNVTLIGLLGRDPEEVHAGQSRFARLSVATDDGYRDQSGQKVERTTWHSVTCGGKTADFVLRYLHKGSQVLVGGPVSVTQVSDQGRPRRRVLVRAGAAGAVPRLRPPRRTAGAPAGRRVR